MCYEVDNPVGVSSDTVAHLAQWPGCVVGTQMGGLNAARGKSFSSSSEYPNILQLCGLPSFVFSV